MKKRALKKKIETLPDLKKTVSSKQVGEFRVVHISVRVFRRFITSKHTSEKVKRHQRVRESEGGKFLMEWKIFFEQVIDEINTS